MENDVDLNDMTGESQTVTSRYWLTNDLLAFMLNLSLILLIFASTNGYTVDLPESILYAYVLSIAVANSWAFGSEALERAYRAIKRK